MRFLLFMITVVTTATVLNTPTKAQNYPWCAQYSDGMGGMNCGFTSFQQCLADVSGIGGFCTQNSTYQTSAGPRVSRFRRGYPY
jgi:hypothetical protein